MRSFSKLFHTSVFAFAVLAGCSAANDKTTANDGTTQIDSSHAFALVSGTIDTSIRGSVKVSVNDSSRDLDVAPDGTFVVRDVPTGDVTFGCEAEGLKGTITITGVQPGETIVIKIKHEGDAIVIVIVERQTSTQPPREVDQPDGDALEIDASRVCYWMKKGTYKRDVIIKGDEVSLFGAAHDSCVLDDRTVLKGKLVIMGNDDRVVDVELEGGLVIQGQNAHVEETCDKCFNEGCDHGCGGSGGDEGNGGGSCHADGGVPVPPGVDAGVPVPPADAGVPSVDAGVPVPPPVDAGVPPTDAGAPIDAGTATDAPAAG